MESKKMYGVMNTSDLISSDVGNSDADSNVVKSDIENLSDAKLYNLTSILSSDPFLLSLLVTSSLSLVLILLYWTFLIYATCNNSSRNIRPPLLKHEVFFGLLIGSLCSISHVILDSASLTFPFISILTPISYTMVYSSLIVRLVCLHSSTKGLALTSFYTSLLQFFCVLGQILLSIQSIFSDLGTLENSFQSNPLMDMVTLSYSFFLLISVICISTMVMNSKMYRAEVRTIWILSLMSMAVWICWVTTAAVFQEYYTLIKFLGLQCSAFLTLAMLFTRDYFVLPYPSQGYHTLQADYSSYRSPRTGQARPSSRQDKAEVNGSQGSASKGSSYQGFHRPTRVVPHTNTSQASLDSRLKMYQPYTIQMGQVATDFPAWYRRDHPMYEYTCKLY